MQSAANKPTAPDHNDFAPIHSRMSSPTLQFVLHQRVHRRGQWRHRCALFCIASILVVAGCATGPDRGGFTDKALDLVGLQTRRGAAEPAAIEAPANRSRRIAVRIHAGEVLNTDASGRSLSLVAKVYALKDADAFFEAPYAVFKDAAPGFGAVELREIVLTPGRKFETVETVADDVRYVGVVGLFRTADERRWRFAFDTKSAATTKITVGAHGCALSVSEGQPVRTSPESMRLAGMRCR